MIRRYTLDLYKKDEEGNYQKVFRVTAMDDVNKITLERNLSLEKKVCEKFGLSASLDQVRKEINKNSVKDPNKNSVRNYKLEIEVREENEKNF